MKTQKQIDDAIQKLKDIKPRVRRYSYFGDDNWKKIDAQIEVLEEKLDDRQIYRRWEDPDTLTDAMIANQWLNGLPIDDLDEEIETLADMWKELTNDD